MARHPRPRAASSLHPSEEPPHQHSGRGDGGYKNAINSNPRGRPIPVPYPGAPIHQPDFRPLQQHRYRRTAGRPLDGADTGLAQSTRTACRFLDPQTQPDLSQSE